MIERLLLTAVFFLLGFALLAVLRQAHGRHVSSLAIAGARPALLYFTGDHCAACVTQSQILQQVVEKWPGRFAIETINAEAELEKASRYGVFTLPTTLVLDPAGTVRHVNYGLADARKLVKQLESI
jgi:thiol-disulfide isomerase/thioredoxin